MKGHESNPEMYIENNAKVDSLTTNQVAVV